MAFAVFSDLSFDLYGNSWTAEVALDGGSSASNTFRLLFARRQVGSERMNPLNPFLSTRVRTSVHDEGRTIHDKIINNSKEDLRLTLKKNSTIWFRGLLREVNGGDKIRLSNPKLQLVWQDGLQTLRNKNWTEKGRVELLDLFHYILTDNTKTDLPTRVALAFNDTEADTSNGRSRALQHALDRQRVDTFYEALSQALRYYNCQVVQEDGKWYVLQRSYRDSSQSYSWEQKDSGGTITSGTTDPTVSISDSDWWESDKHSVRRSIVRAQGWELDYQYSRRGWVNPDFSEDRAHSLTGNTEPLGWVLKNAITFDDGNDQLKITPGTDEYAEQIWETIILNKSSTLDRFDVRIKGEVDILDTNETVTIQVDVVRVIAVKPDTASKQYRNNSGWTGSADNLSVTVQQSDNGTVTRSFDQTFDISAPGSSPSEWIIKIQPRTGGTDPDSDSNDEVSEVRIERAEILNYEKVTPEGYSLPPGIRYLTDKQADRESEGSQIGTVSNRSSQFASVLETRNFGGIWFLDLTSGEWQLLHTNSEMEHAGRGYTSDKMGILRLNDRHAMFSSDLTRFIGLQKPSTAKIRDTIVYDSKDLLVHYVDESIGKSRWLIGVTELKNDSIPSNSVRVEQK